ncbi:MAG TPA: epoxide hydrolase [Actinocrinis sp.]|uniref:epoxide hydrolase family protein n=1 Tax=Actinocrinis sp. TaxID=1920516 RepID=UPI002D61C1F7|nr:epoxide hydrolase [Actinocrinis sp.]HZU56427.1 epoxide hydrolase [Actinocrinis sp.]
MSAVPIPFRHEVPQSELDDLRDRLARTRWPEPQTVDDWSQGVPLDYLREIAEYWRTGYDWRATERRLAELSQFLIEIDGIRVHYIHVRSPHPDALPLLVTHGWPGSITDLLDLVEPLTNPADPADAFHLVLPSLPGYGYSDKPSTPGWNVERIAEAWAKLMADLGYGRYGAHGTDWGSFVTAALGTADPAHLVGIQIAMPFASAPSEPVELSQRDLDGLAALKEFQKHEGGYSAIQATRPQTIGYALTDSPAGQLAWALEKYWAWSDHDGDLDKAIPRDRVLDAVSVNWFARTAASSARIYWESHNAMRFDPVRVPAGCSTYPKDGRMPKPWCERRFTDLREWIDHEEGGHFPALEDPQRLSEELRAFFRPLR